MLYVGTESGRVPYLYTRRVGAMTPNKFKTRAIPAIDFLNGESRQGLGEWKTITLRTSSTHPKSAFFFFSSVELRLS